MKYNNEESYSGDWFDDKKHGKSPNSQYFQRHLLVAI
jgi:hypothetical protein